MEHKSCFSAIHKHRVVLVVLCTVVIFGGLFLCAKSCFWGSERRTAPEEYFSFYLTYPDNTELLQKAANIQAEVLDMGQGVYLRFEADKELVFEFLEYAQGKAGFNHYPYVSISCGEFYGIPYPAGEGKRQVVEWWEPREVTHPECYVTKECEYFLFDTESETIYYWYRPDFLSKRFYCVNSQGEREDVRRR